MVAPDKLVDSSMDRAESKGESEEQAASITNGNDVQPTNDQITNNKSGDGSRQPSYVALACCISGYTTLHYDSKQRQGLRSPRPLSPNRPPSANNGNQIASYKSECGNYLTPSQPELSSNMPIEGKGVEVLNGCQSLSSPRHISRMSLTSESRRNFTSSMISEGYTSYSSSSSTSHYSYSTTSSTQQTHKTELTNGSRLIQATKAPTQVSPSSFIVQRVERLYGPGALAQGFYSPRRISLLSKETKGSTPDRTSEKVEEEGSLPVLKLLRPEFRAQLTVAARKSKSPESKSVSENSSKNSMLNEHDQKIPTDTVDATIVEKTHDLHIEEEEKKGNYFLKLLDEKVSELEHLADKADEELATCDNEEGAGILRAVSGKARLLVAEKLNQFRGLCYKNLKQTDDEDFPTTNEDLAGFWDMVLIQIKAVLAQFEEIDEIRKNNWKQLTPKPKVDNAPKAGGAHRKLAPRKLNSEPKVSAASKARDEARRKLIEEKRKAMKNLKKEEDDTVIMI